MNRIVEMIANLPMPAKVGGAVAIVGGATGVLYMFGGSSAMYVVIAGLVVIGFVLMGYSMVLKLMQNRKAAPMEKSISGNAAAAPTGITEPARRARLDDLRKNFDTGVEKFKAAGKNLYALPWYLLVGEPGSGKTEAIRHCNVGFPPGLQDQLQGVGGTLNMNWWFTNYAIILDTAGRLMFEEVEPGSTSEWQEFLKLLRKNRPNCPINGMLLVIPAESLIRDTAESLERKGGKIAQQLDSIQRILGVRFPVFVIITKCDLINGFREFFDELNDPALQHQILGWSNPAPLDTTFSPEQVEQHLRSVQERLQRRRLGLMLDPVNTEDPRSRRTDQVDAMYAFPDAMIKIAPRLRRYLEMIFVAGEWSQKPLFLRGIYFTSSMREGSALDQELAEAFGIPVENLPEGRVWERDRAYFLRDLFMQKVFREKGLVTRAVNTSKHQKLRRNLVLGTATVGLLLVGAFTWLGASSLNKTIVTPSVFWEKTSKLYLNDSYGEKPRGLMSEQYLPIVQRTTDAERDFKYFGGTDEEARKPLDDLPVDSERRTRAGMAAELRNQAKLEIGVPWVFRPVAAVLGDTSGSLAEAQRTQAARVVFEGSILRPLVDAAKINIDRDSSDNAWTPEATSALAQVLRLEMANIPGNKGAELVDLEPLMRYALRGNDHFTTKGAQADLKQIDEAYRSLYSVSGDSWPPESMRSSNRATINKGVDAFNTSWVESASTGVAANYLAIKRLADAMREFGAAEDQLWALAGVANREYPQVLADWQAKYAAVKAAHDKIEREAAALKGRSIKLAFTEELEKYRTELRKQHELLLKELAPLVDAEGKPTDLAKSGKDDGGRVDGLSKARAAIATSMETLGKDSKEITDLKSKLDELDALYIVNAAEPAYGLRFKMYQLADQRVNPTGGADDPKPGDTRVLLKNIDDNTAADAKTLGDLLRSREGVDPMVTRYNEAQKSARRVSTAMVELGNQKRRAIAIDKFLLTAKPGTSLADVVAQVAQASNWLVDRPAVPMSPRKEKFDARYAPKAAAAVVGDYMSVRNALKAGADAPAGSVQPGGVLGAAELRPRFRPLGEDASAYFRAYAAYWTGGIADELGVNPGATWADFAGQLVQNARVDTINQALEQVQKAAQAASDEMTAVVERDASDRANGEAYDALTKLTSQAKSTIASSSFVTGVDRVLANWKALGMDGGTARRTVMARINGPAGVNEYLLLTQGELKDADFVQRYYRDLTFKALKTLASDAGGGVAQAIAQLRGGLKFPLVRYSDPQTELGAGDLAPLKAAFEQVKGAIGAGAAAAGGGAAGAWTRDRDVNDEITRLTSRDAITEQDREFLERTGKMLAALPGAGEEQVCEVTILGTKAPKPGNESMNAFVPYMAVTPAGGPVGRIVGLFGGAETKLVTFRGPGDRLELRFLETDNANSKVLATVDIPSKWSAMYLIDRYSGRPAGPGNRRSWEVEVETDFQGKKSLWLRLDFEKELPELPWYK